jgi:peptidoglycan/LPS O-acetylase OafA/YrhL
MSDAPAPEKPSPEPEEAPSRGLRRGARAENATTMIAGLDGVRALAIILVILLHGAVIGFGWVGVNVFFVLSGFLITRILLRDLELPARPYFTRFYGRRSLRIFPIYYAYLLGLAVLVFTPAIRDHFNAAAAVTPSQLLFASTYTYDFYHASSAFVHSTSLSHFWSLAVEEQFYLIWPLALRYIGKRRLPAACLAIILAGPLVRIAIAELWSSLPFASPISAQNVYVLPFSHFDAFATGALLTVWRPGRVSKRAYAGLFASTLALGALASRRPLSLFPRELGFPLLLGAGHAYIWGYTLVNILSAGLMMLAMNDDVVRRVFEWRPLKYLGKVSYGVYVYHYLVLSLIDLVIARKMGRSVATQWLTVGIGVPVTLAVSAISFRFFEEPILRLKDRWFPATRPVTTS